MKSIKIKIKPVSSFKSKLQSDTIFGMFCWMYKYIYGEKKFLEVLNEYENKPFIVFSDGFFENTLPRPILNPIRNEILDKLILTFIKDEELLYPTKKKLKKITLVNLKDFLGLNFTEVLKEENIIAFLLENLINTKKEKTKKIEISHILKNSVNRIKNTTTEGLYMSVEYFYNTPIDIYAKYDEDMITAEEIKEVFEKIGKTGFGADKSTGKGRFEILSMEEEFELKKFLIPENNKDKNGFISLSSGLVIDDKITLNYGKIFTKFGKLGGDRAITGNHFKNPIILYQPGSTFFIEEHKDFYGNATNRVFKNKDGYHSGYMIPFFVRLNREV